MNINTLFAVGGLTFFIYLIYKSLKPKPLPFAPQRSGLLVAQDTGKSKVNQSKTGDASLAIERVRRRAIQGAGRVAKYKLKETHTQLGSTTGALETYFISSICPCPPSCLPYDVVYDGGDENDEFCAYDGDGTVALDAGDDTTKACGV